MRAEGPSAIDWRDPAPYATLLSADRSLFAWEWLRRDRQYAEAAQGCLAAPRGRRQQEAARFGLVDFEPPELVVPDARPLWSALVHPFVLSAAPGHYIATGDQIELGHFGGLTTLVAGEERDHLLLCDGFWGIRIDAPPGTFDRPVCLQYQLEGVETAARPLVALQRFIALCRNGSFSRSLHPAERRARRWVLMLRAYDALACGAGQREIALELLSRTALEPRWRSREPSTRSQAQRLVRSVRAFAAGGYRALLG